MIPDIALNFQVPPSIVQRVDEPKFSRSFIDYIKRAENISMNGRRNGRWYVVTEPTGHRMIAYGHKVMSNTYASGITDAEAEALLINDMTKAWGVADTHLYETYNIRMFNLSQRQQEMLVDYAFNAGTLSKFPRMVSAVVSNHKPSMLAEHRRYYKTPRGCKRELTGRNRRFRNFFLNDVRPEFCSTPSIQIQLD